MGPATSDPIPYQLPLHSPSEPATLAAQTSTKVLVAAAAATVERNQRMAEFTTVAGIKARAAAIAASATEEEAAHAAQITAGAALIAAQTAIAEADVTTTTT